MFVSIDCPSHAPNNQRWNGVDHIATVLAIHRQCCTVGDSKGDIRPASVSIVVTRTGPT